MPEPAPQSPAPEHEPSQPASDAPPGPDAAATKSTPNSALFHTLLEGGFDAVVAYTAERRMRTMTSDIADDRLQMVLAEIRELRENMATKADLANFQARFIKRMLGALMVQMALIVALVKSLS